MKHSIKEQKPVNKQMVYFDEDEEAKLADVPEINYTLKTMFHVKPQPPKLPEEAKKQKVKVKRKKDDDDDDYVPFNSFNTRYNYAQKVQNT